MSGSFASPKNGATFFELGSRWADDDDIRQVYRDRALDDLRSIGVSRAFMKRMVAFQHAEIELHPWDAADAVANRIHEAAADLPWEYLLSAGTRGVGRHHSLLVTRLFRNNRHPTILARPNLILFVESAPGRIEDHYEFSSERRRIRAAVGADREAIETPNREMGISETENIADLKKRVRRKKWDVLHVTGVDTHQVAWQLPEFYEEEVHAGPGPDLR